MWVEMTVEPLHIEVEAILQSICVPSLFPVDCVRACFGIGLREPVRHHSALVGRGLRQWVVLASACVCLVG